METSGKPSFGVGLMYKSYTRNTLTRLKGILKVSR
jgi:hypothetical protein